MNYTGPGNMALGEEGCWIPPLRKYTGVPSLAALRRTALTPWNSQDSGSGTGSPPDSPGHALNQENSKADNIREKSPSEAAPSPKLSPVNGQVRSNDAASKDDDGLRIDRIFKMNANNKLDRRRVKSSEPLCARGKNHLKSASWTDGRDSIRLKNKDNSKERHRRNNTQQVRSPKPTKIVLCRNKTLTPKPQISVTSNRSANETDSNNLDGDIPNNPLIQVTEIQNENCDNDKPPLPNNTDSITGSSPPEQENKNNLIAKEKSESNTGNLVRGISAQSNKSYGTFKKRTPSPYSSRNMNTIKVNHYSSYSSKRTSSRMSTISKVEAIEAVEHIVIEQNIGDVEEVKGNTDYSKEESKKDTSSSSSSESEDECDVYRVVKDERREAYSICYDKVDDDNDDSTSEDKADDDTTSEDKLDDSTSNKVNDDNDDSTSDEKVDDDQDDSTSDDKGDDDRDDELTSVKDQSMKEKKMDTLEVPSPKPNATPQQQILRIHGITLTKDKLKKLRSIVDKAAQRKKVFTIFGKYPSVRDALTSRGWVQNFDLQKLTAPHTRQNDNEVSVYAKLRLGAGVGEEELALISRMLRDTPVHFVWIMGDTVDWKSLSKTTIVSRFPRVYFTTKVGLCSYLEDSHWFSEASVSHVNFPRCYTTDDLAAFVRDFRLTACLGLIKTLLTAVDNKQPNIFLGKIPLSAVKFAVKRCSEFVSVEEHEDIDIDSEERVWDHQWDQFLTYYYQLVHEGETFVTANEEQIKALYSCCQTAVEAVKPFWPQLELDGLSNLWLVKPGAKSRGRGISVCNKLERIMTKLGSSNQPSTDINPPACSSRFVIQKYVEKPLLIHNTKFDIRQWFLVTSAYPLTIWMYKESYLRFCSQLFSLSNLHESVHLTNNAVQCRYRNQIKRDKALPDENMWDSYTFQAYLRTLGRRDEWESVVYPGMRESITGALLAAQDHMEARTNCFELYGADFILTEDLKPWLIEINSSPAMSATTSVTARMCPQCLEDVIKVVIDRRTNRDAPTGQFELIYRQNVSTPQPYMGMNLTVRGSPAPRGKVPPPSWPPPADGIQPPSQHAAIQAALDSLAEHLVTIT